MSTEKDVTRDVIFARLESLLKGRTVSQFARDCEIKQPVMDAYIKRKRMPVAENLRKICIANDVTSDWLLNLTDENGAPQKPSATLTTKIIRLKEDAVNVHNEVGELLTSIEKIMRAL